MTLPTIQIKRRGSNAEAFSIIVKSDRRSKWFAADGMVYSKLEYVQVDPLGIQAAVNAQRAAQERDEHSYRAPAEWASEDEIRAQRERETVDEWEAFVLNHSFIEDAR